MKLPNVSIIIFNWNGVLAAYGVEDHRAFVADSFEGLPKPDTANYPDDKGDRHHTMKYLSVSEEDVKNNFKKYDLLDEQVIFLKGCYESTMDALNNLYPKLSKGGFCIIDDYALKGCKEAVDDYRAKNQIDDEIKVIDWLGIYWRKS